MPSEIPLTGCTTINISCTNVPANLSDFGVITGNYGCVSSSHCYDFTAIGEEFCVPYHNCLAYESCKSDCSCLGINPVNYSVEAYKYFSTADNCYLYQKYFKNSQAVTLLSVLKHGFTPIMIMGHRNRT